MPCLSVAVFVGVATGRLTLFQKVPGRLGKQTVEHGVRGWLRPAEILVYGGFNLARAIGLQLLLLGFVPSAQASEMGADANQGLFFPRLIQLGAWPIAAGIVRGCFGTETINQGFNYGWDGAHPCGVGWLG